MCAYTVSASITDADCESGGGVGEIDLTVTGGLSYQNSILDIIKDNGTLNTGEKEDAKAKGYLFLPLKQLLAENEVIITCLNKNTILLHETEFESLGNRKIVFNTGLSPAWDALPFEKWLNGDNRFFCDTIGALGDVNLLQHKNVHCIEVSSGRTQQAFIRLSEKVLDNLTDFVKMQ